MMLLVDIGNTRVKWASCTDGQLSMQHAAEYAHWSVDDWGRELFDGAGPVDRVAAVSVAGDAGRHALVAAAARRGIDAVVFHTSSADACGVRNAYRDPALLGVDRWAAVIGAHHLFWPRACCVVDVGTATTIDAVAGDGRHLGGFIMPGPDLMVRALLAGTSDLASHTAASTVQGGSLFADNTREAIERGCRITLAASIDRCLAELGRTVAAAPVLVVTGGAATEVVPYVLAPVEFVPALVLYGVSRLAWNGS
jgi:type III pantothenate kinase